MQLILNTEAAVDIKAKMSLTEDNLEKCALNVHSAVSNGDVSNGDIPNEDNEVGDNIKNDQMEQVNENVVKSTDYDLEQLNNGLVSNNANIETSRENHNEIDQAVDTVNGTDDNKSTEQIVNVNNKLSSEILTEETEHSDHDSIKTDTEINNDNIIADASESVPIEEEHNDNMGVTTGTESNHENISINRIADANESVITEKKYIDVVDINKEVEFNYKDSPVNSIADANESNSIEKGEKDAVNTNTNAESNNESNTINSITDETENIIMEKEDNDVAGIVAETEINDKDVCTNIIVDHNNKVTEICNVNSNEATTNITVDHEDMGTAKNTENVEHSNLSCTVDASEKVSDTIDNVSSKEQLDDNDVLPKIDSTGRNTGEDINDNEESISVEANNIAVKKENVFNMETNNEKEPNISVPMEKVKMETDDMDTSDENIDLINLNIGINEKITNMSASVEQDKMDKDENVDLININVKKESEDVIESIKTELEETECKMNAIEEKERAVDSNSATSKLSFMDVDETTENTNVKVKLEANPEISTENSISNVNKNSENVLVADCNVIEPVITQKGTTANQVPGSSDDIIFNLDDDREPEPDLVKPIKSESSEIVEDDEKLVTSCNDVTKKSNSVPVSKSSDVIIDLDENIPKDLTDSEAHLESSPEKTGDEPKIPPVLKLSNTLDILSDEEDEPKETNADSKCINIEDDDDVMLIDEDTGSNEHKTEPAKEIESENQEDSKPKSPAATMEINEESEKIVPESTSETDTAVSEKDEIESIRSPPAISEKLQEIDSEHDNKTPLLHEKFLKTCKKNLSDMTREELEEFCILKIVESVIDRSSLSEVKAKLKSLTQNIEEYNKKAKMLTKQNRDLQVVLKSLQEDQKEGKDSITPLKITRSVGMQVLMSDKVVQRRKVINLPSAPVNKPTRNPVTQSPRPQKQQAPQIPVPRLVPANNPTLKSPSTQPPNTGKITSPLPNGMKSASPVQKGEKRTHNRIQSVTVDLTDDEPPAKILNRALAPPVPPVRLVPSQNLLAPPRPTTVNSPRKVYIPISGPQGQSVRPGQTIMLKTVSGPNPRQRCPPPHMVRMPQNLRMQRPQGLRHPAPLPDCMKQYQPPNWKALPPAPDLKLAKVENGIVISWKIEGYQEDSYEEIASYQLYAYQETASPPNTALWKKIGDVKALPLPMACTLTQFMAGYKYYFAVRAVDIRSRLGPFSLPGSILLLNKM